MAPFFQQYFQNATVEWAQSSEPKPEKALVLLKWGHAKYNLSPDFVIADDGEPVFTYTAEVVLEVDLYTNGTNAFPEEEYSSQVNTAVHDLIQFMLFLNSPKALAFADLNNLTILPSQNGSGEPTDVSSVLNDSSYEYRARVELGVSFTTETKGIAGGEVTGDTGWFNKVNLSTPKPGQN